jgi:hypothetical protein
MQSETKPDPTPPEPEPEWRVVEVDRGEPRLRYPARWDRAAKSYEEMDDREMTGRSSRPISTNH